MLLEKEVTQASDVELLTVILGKRGTAETLLQKAGGSLFTLFFAMPQEGRDMSCAQGSKGLRGRSEGECVSLQDRLQISHQTISGPDVD